MRTGESLLQWSNTLTKAAHLPRERSHRPAARQLLDGADLRRRGRSCSAVSSASSAGPPAPMYALALPPETLAHAIADALAPARAAQVAARARRALPRCGGVTKIAAHAGRAQRLLPRVRERPRRRCPRASTRDAARVASGRCEATAGCDRRALDAGAYAPGQEKAPRALRDAGLLAGLRSAGSRWSITATQRPGAGAPIAAAHTRSTSLPSSPARPRRPSAYAGARRRRARAGAGRRLHGRSRHRRRAPARRGAWGSCTSTSTATSTRPTASPTARSTGWASPTCWARKSPAELSGFGPWAPLLDDDQIVLLALRRDQSTARELETIERRRLATVPLSRRPPIRPRPRVRRLRRWLPATGWPCTSMLTASTSPMPRSRRDTAQHRPDAGCCVRQQYAERVTAAIACFNDT